MDSDNKVELIVELCTKLAGILKDPGQGSKDISAEQRVVIREQAYNDLLSSIEILGLIAQYSSNIFDVLDIVHKYNVKIEPTK